MDRLRMPEEEIADLFRSAGQELTEAVGLRPGEVWRFARPTTGITRPRTLWQVWMSRPMEWSEALDALEQTRVAAGADRALAVLWEQSLPQGYSTDLERRPSTVITRRRLALELAGVPELVRQHIAEYERAEGARYHLKRHGDVNGQPVDDMAAYIVQWSQSEAPPPLRLTAEDTGRTDVVLEAEYRVGRMFLQDPEGVKPLFRSGMLRHGFVSSVPIDGWCCRWVHSDVEGVDLSMSYPGGMIWVAATCWGSSETAVVSSLAVAQLGPPTDQELLEWYGGHLPSGAVELVVEAFRQNSGFAALLREPSLLRGWRESLALVTPREGETYAQRTAEVIVTFFEFIAGMQSNYSAPLLLKPLEMLSDVLDARVEALKDAAPEDFALQRAAPLLDVEPWEDECLRWLGVRSGAATIFVNSLVRDYFLALRILREVQSGHRGVLTRYQFPREYVLLFLAILSPEVSAFASEDRSNALRAEIEQKAEQEVQLILAHQLNRSVGAIRAQVEIFRELVPQAASPEAERALRRVDQELDYIHRLADRTRRLHRKYAEAIGGRVELDPDRPETTFFVRLVRAKGAQGA